MLSEKRERYRVARAEGSFPEQVELGLKRVSELEKRKVIVGMLEIEILNGFLFFFW